MLNQLLEEMAGGAPKKKGAKFKALGMFQKHDKPDAAASSGGVAKMKVLGMFQKHDKPDDVATEEPCASSLDDASALTAARFCVVFFAAAGPSARGVSAVAPAVTSACIHFFASASVAALSV